MLESGTYNKETLYAVHSDMGYLLAGFIRTFVLLVIIPRRQHISRQAVQPLQEESALGI